MYEVYLMPIFFSVLLFTYMIILICIFELNASVISFSRAIHSS